jgi:UDP-glucose 4-epimerase
VRILVTGGAGAIGSHLVARLVADHHEVTVIDNLSSGRQELVHPSVRFVHGSVADVDELASAFDPAPDLVAHLAAVFANQNSVDHPETDLIVSGLATLRILDRSLAAGVQKVLVCSSSCVYREAEELDETSPVGNRSTPYAITKGLAEDYASFYAHHHGLPTVVVRPFNSYGPHEHPGQYRNVIPNFLAAALRGEPLTITGTGDETRDFTYVEDTADGMALALLGPTAPGSTYNLATGRETRIADLARLVNDVTGNPAGVVNLPARAWDTTARRRGRIDRARADLGFEPRVGIEEGVRRTANWLRTVASDRPVR